MRSAAAGEHRTGEDTAKRTLGRARRRATVAERDGELRGLAKGAAHRARAETPRGERPQAAVGRFTSGVREKGAQPLSSGEAGPRTRVVRPHEIRGDFALGPLQRYGANCRVSTAGASRSLGELECT